MMKVLFVTRGWPTKENPMSGNYEAVQAKAVARLGVDVTVLNFKWRSVFRPDKSAHDVEFTDDGIHVIQQTISLPVLPHVLNNFKLNRFFKQQAVIRFYRRYLRNHTPFDVIHAHSAFEAYLLPPMTRRFRIPLVITEHWSKMNESSITAEIRAMSEAYRTADAIVTVSKALADSLKSKFGVESRVIHNMVPDSFFSSQAASRPNGRIRLVSTGALREPKGFDILIKGLALARHREDCSLTIIGDGPERENLQKCIDEQGLQDRVTLAGRKTPEEVSQLLCDADCFALTSRTETFGIVYIEAMAKGLPVIATVCGGPESFVNEHNGLLIPVDDVEATARAIDHMAEHIGDYDHKAIRQFCYDSFSQDRIAEQIVKVYQEVLQRTR